ncbi:MAG: hypothetical protein IJ368_02400 [Oscillospiraceae bacterium]|nr:hypothetical protein [Oscillospiraceae bacterium]
MEMVLSQLEGIISDIVFSGTENAGTDIFRRIGELKRLCGELEMETLAELCGKLEECFSEERSRDAAVIISRMCCYAEGVNMNKM